MKIYFNKKACLIIFVLSGLMISATQFMAPPQAEISNGLIGARLYLPDEQNGYYRGARFDWSGVISNLEYKGHTFYGQWFQKYSPTLHDAIMGPVEDFDPLGYNEAKPGETFVKIGIGVLSKPNETPYLFTTPYQIMNYGKWTVKKKADQVEFVHKLDDKQYSYEYKKTVQLTKGKPEMVLMHTLKNTGKQTIETTVYDHNFLMIDQQPIGSDYSVEFAFPLTGEGKIREDLAKIDENKIVFLNNLAKNDHVHYTALHGFGDSAKDYDIKVENTKTGAGVRITSDQPLSRLVLWSASTTVCPEPYIKIKVNPGESFSWKISYNYFTSANK